ncbi:MAG: hypothetical protein ACKOCH_04140, partial [Bacteroidota bacterium]
AKSDKEQELFRALFAEADARVLPDFQLPNNDPGNTPPVPNRDESPLLIAAIAYLLLALLAAALWMTRKIPPPPVVTAYLKREVILSPRQKAALQPSDLLSAVSSGITRFTLDSINGQTPGSPS